MMDQILQQLTQGPQTLFEMAAGLNVAPSDIAEPLAHLIVNKDVWYEADGTYWLSTPVAAEADQEAA